MRLAIIEMAQAGASMIQIGGEVSDEAITDRRASPASMRRRPSVSAAMGVEHQGRSAAFAPKMA
jgi:hypothetical protein